MRSLVIQYINFLICVGLTPQISCSQSGSNSTNGTLHASGNNPRYFTCNSGKAIYLTRSHTWNDLVDMGPTSPPEEIDFNSDIRWMKKYDHNFIRLWTWEILNWDTQANNDRAAKLLAVSSQPWMRTVTFF